MNVRFVIADPTGPKLVLQQPVETLYAATLVRELGHDVKIHDLRLPGHSVTPDDDCDLIFVVTQTYDRSQCYSLSLKSTRDVVDDLRTTFGDTPLVAVGVHATLEPALTERSLGVDIALPGELEAAIPWFLGHASASGLDAIDVTRAPRFVDPADLPVPDYSLIDADAYRSEWFDPERRQAFFDTSGLILANRGCPYPCEYCFVWLGKKVRYRPVPLVIAELEAQLERGITNFFFLDYTFTLNRQWVIELCETIIELALPVTWLCETRCDRVDSEILRLMRLAGCRGVFYGIEAPWVADAGVSKLTSRETIDEAIRITDEAGLGVFLFMIIGFEGRDPRLADALVAWLAEQSATFTATPIQPRPRTALWAKGISADFAPQEWEDIKAASDDLARRDYWVSEIEALQTRLAALPNYIRNVPVRNTTATVPA